MVTGAPLPTPRLSKPMGWLLVFVVGVMSLIAFLVISTPWPNPPLWQIKRISSLEFPDSARVLNSSGRFFLEIDIVAKIEMDKADLEQFLSKLPPGSSISDSDRAHLSSLFGRWGDPSSAKESKRIHFSRSGNGDKVRSYDIAIDLDDPYKAVVYLWYWYE